MKQQLACSRKSKFESFAKESDDELSQRSCSLDGKKNKLKSIFLQNDANNIDDACNECNLTTSIIEEGSTCF